MNRPLFWIAIGTLISWVSMQFAWPHNAMVYASLVFIALMAYEYRQQRLAEKFRRWCEDAAKPPVNRPHSQRVNGTLTDEL